MSGAERTAEKDALAGVTESDRRDVSAWLIREADHRVKFFPQRRDGIDTLMRHLAASVIPPAVTEPGDDQ